MSYSEYTCNVKNCKNTEWIANVDTPIPNPDTFWCEECHRKAAHFKFIGEKKNFFLDEIKKQEKIISEYQWEIEQLKHQIEGAEIGIGWSLKKIDILKDEEEVYLDDFAALQSFDIGLLESMKEEDHFSGVFHWIIEAMKEEEEEEDSEEESYDNHLDGMTQDEIDALVELEDELEL